MPRPVWKGHISFGLVMVPVTLYSLKRTEADLSFHMLDSRDQSRVRYVRVNEQTGKEVPWNSIVKGYEVSDGQYVVLKPSEFKKAAPKATRTAEIVGFVDGEEISPKYYDKPYVLEPGEGGEKGYVLLREALAKSGRVGIAKLVIHTRQYVAAMIPEGDALMLVTMRFDREIRALEDFKLPEGSAKSLKVTPKELQMAETLIDGMTGGWDPSEYHDEYTEQLKKWIEQRAKAGKAVAVEEAEDADEDLPGPYSIMDLLKKSVDEQKSAGGGKRSSSRKATTRKKTKPVPARRKAG